MQNEKLAFDQRTLLDLSRLSETLARCWTHFVADFTQLGSVSRDVYARPSMVKNNNRISFFSLKLK